ncbi:MAG: DNA-protecting protein DprA [Actinobacteria bacterium]|nr:DNA-protecting protein DprA [Actinomycetota bacterium]
MLKINEIRLQLFAAIEPGDQFWSDEIAKHGVLEIYSRITSHKFYLKNKSLPRIISDIESSNPDRLLDQIKSSGGEFLTPEDIDWPQQLEDLISPPIGLVIRGQRETISSIENSISIVGTRNPTNYGVRISGDLSAAACDRNFAVISGGAYGIDTAAHKGALAAEGVTVAVLGGGINSLYPSGNARLFQEIKETGLLISEVMPGVPAQPFRFLIRNRLIAALSKGTVVTEAAFRSGSIRTARDAAEIMRPVFAVPGPVTSPLSDGCHRLIAERVADIATSVDEILEMVTPLHLR